jgi:hypothetical protein
MSRLTWGAWATIPVLALAFHYGPGQAYFQRDRAASMVASAEELETEAARLHAAAYEKHLAALQARRTAMLAQTPENDRAMKAATVAETQAVAEAASAWRLVAGTMGEVIEVVGEASPKTVRALRWSRARALVRSGELWTGIGELEDLLTEIPGTAEHAESDIVLASDGGANVDEPADPAFERAVRQEVGAAYYYAARLMRLSGKPAEEWRVESGKARQHFRYLAESAREQGLPEDEALSHERNVELVLDLEQSGQFELEGKPLPKDSPSNCMGNRPGKKPGRKGPKPRPDARGAGGAEAVREGW